MRQKCSIDRQVSFDDKGSFSMKAITISVAIAAAISPAAAHAEDFLGGRIAVVGGWDGVNVDVENIGGTGINIDESHDGATFGILTGYNFPHGPGAIIGIGTSTMFPNNNKQFTRDAASFNIQPGRQPKR